MNARQLVFLHGWKYVFGLSFLIAAVGLSVQAFRPAYANIGPAVSYGGNPYMSFSSCIQHGQSIELISLSTEQSFVVRTAIMEGSAEFLVNLLSAGTILVEGSSYVMTAGTASALTQGNGRAVVPAGQDLSISYSYNPGHEVCYYIDGYYIQP